MIKATGSARQKVRSGWKKRASGAVRCTSLKLLRAHRKLVTIAATEIIREIIDKIERVQRGKEEVL